MSEAYAEPPRATANKSPLDRWLTVAITVLILAFLALAGWFGYNVWADYQADQATNAPTRLVLSLEDAVRKTPNDATLRVRLGEAYGAAKRYKQAIEQFNEALKLEPKHVGAYLDLGMVAVLTEHPAQAEGYFQKVVELTDKAQFSKVDERRENAIYNLGLLALDRKAYDEAAGYFKEALRIRKDASDTYLMLARALKGMEDPDGAMENLEIALNFDPGFAEAHFMMGELFRDKKDDVNASYHFYKAVELAPEADLPREALDAYGPATDWIARAEASAKEGDIEGALKQVLVARNLDPSSVAGAKLHASILIERGDFKDAVDVLLQAQALDQKDTEVQKQLADLERQHPKDALAAYKAMLEKNPTDKELKAKVAELKKAAS